MWQAFWHHLNRDGRGDVAVGAHFREVLEMLLYRGHRVYYGGDASQWNTEVSTCD